MKKTNFKFEGIDIPLRFITVHENLESFLTQAKKQFFYDLKPDAQEAKLKAMYESGKALEAQNAEAEKAEAEKAKAEKTQKPKPKPEDKDKGDKTP
jgi:ABC-type phosphate/phosphonate transport system substrate-binding protein